MESYPARYLIGQFIVLTIGCAIVALGAAVILRWAVRNVAKFEMTSAAAYKSAFIAQYVASLICLGLYYLSGDGDGRVLSIVISSAFFLIGLLFYIPSVYALVKDPDGRRMSLSDATVVSFITAGVSGLVVYALALQLFERTRQ